MTGHRLCRRLRALLTMRAALTCTLVLLVVSSSSLVLFTPVAAAPDGVEDRATFTVRTGGIYPHSAEGGQICAEKTAPDVNKVTVTNATLKDVDIYLSRNDRLETHISFPSGEVNGALVLYTNGENALVNTLATLGTCLPPGTPNPLPTTLEAYWLGVANLQPSNLELTSGGNAPEPGGPSLTQLLEATNTSPAAVGLNNSSNTTNNTTTPPENRTVDQRMNETTNTTTPPVNKTVTQPTATSTKTVTTTEAPNGGEKTTPPTKTAIPTRNTTVPTVERAPPTHQTTSTPTTGTNRSAVPTTQPPTTRTGTPLEGRNSSLNETVDGATNMTNTTSTVSPTATDPSSGTTDDILESVSNATNETTGLLTTNTSTTTTDGSDSDGGLLGVSGVVNALSGGGR